ncbi:MAG: class I SAM-dependent methyltransferase [Syntrophus sp. (in: bacteria)]|nr:class I SAM-dependent methyltransferase [Syntrophus sp. (in: bacteria)]
MLPLLTISMEKIIACLFNCQLPSGVLFFVFNIPYNILPIAAGNSFLDSVVKALATRPHGIYYPYRLSGGPRMAFYEEIAEYYDDIFPFNKTQMEFVRGSLKGPYHDKKVLDIGCGTGDLAIALSEAGFAVTGIDADSVMIQKAMDKITHHPATFTRMDMREIASHNNPSAFDAVLCFGNTLVHLANIQEIETLCKDVKHILKQDGKFLLQILNYDYILDHNIRSLPFIDNQLITFERIYNYDTKKNLITFKTILTVKETSKKIVNKVSLFPIRKDELYLSLHNSGFSNISFYGDFDRNMLKTESLPLVIEAS